jgi:hypothetical protein
MSGEEKSCKTATELKEELHQKLLAYENSVGLRVKPNQAEKYWNLTEDELRYMTPEQCEIAAYALSTYALYLQKSQNEEIAVMKWADAMISKEVTPYLNNYQYKDSDERRILAIQEQPYTKELYQLRTYAEARVDRLNFLANHIEKIAQKLENLYRAKMKR